MNWGDLPQWGMGSWAGLPGWMRFWMDRAHWETASVSERIAEVRRVWHRADSDSVPSAHVPNGWEVVDQVRPPEIGEVAWFGDWIRVSRRPPRIGEAIDSGVRWLYSVSEPDFAVCVVPGCGQALCRRIG